MVMVAGEVRDRECQSRGGRPGPYDAEVECVQTGFHSETERNLRSEW